MSNRDRESAPTRIVLLRHGPTEWSQSGRYTGLTDIRLTDDGRRVAGDVGPVVAAMIGDRPDAEVDVVTSPLARASETAALAMPDRSIRRNELLREWDYGELEGLTIAEIRGRMGNDWHLLETAPPGGETAAAVQQRCAAFVRSLAVPVTVAVSHGHLLKALASVLLAGDLSLVESFYLSSGGILVVDRIDGGWRLTALRNCIDPDFIPEFL